MAFKVTIPGISSKESSLSSSPASSPVGQGVYPYNSSNLDSAPEPRDVYDTTLSWWRAAIRRRLVQSIHWESRVIARMQVS